MWLNKIIKLIINRDFRANLMYTSFFEKKILKENEVVFQSFDGNSISGNVYYIK